MNQYFPKPYEPFGGDINVKVDVSNYAIKADIKNILHVELKTNLANLRTDVDKLDIDKLVPVPFDLSKLSNVVTNDVVKKDVYDKLVTNVNAIPLNDIDTSRFVLKTKYDRDKSELENKVPDTSGLVEKTGYNTKIAKIGGKIPDISNLATKTPLTIVENKIPSVSNLATKKALTNVENKILDVNSLVKKTNYNTKVVEIDTKLSTTLMVKLLKIKMILLKLEII